MSYSWNLNERGWSVYQTGHGAAYDLAGSDTANPLGQVQTLAALLRESYGLVDLAATLVSACDTVLATGRRTADIPRPGSVLLSTREMGAAVAEQLTLELTAEREVGHVSRMG
jgi:3-isopropylmalate dehydrogenase